MSKERNHSDLPQGDEDPNLTANRMNMTTNKFHFSNVSLQSFFLKSGTANIPIGTIEQLGQCKARQMCPDPHE